MKITTKTQMYDLYNRGLLGNGLRNWDTLAECLANCGDSLVGIRSRRIGGLCLAMLTPGELAREFETRGLRDCDYLIGESPDHHHQTMQGEIARSEYYFNLTYTFEKAPMRIAFARDQWYTTGLKAKALVEKYMDANTLNDLQELWDVYPEAVIEFTCFDCNIGTKPHRNTIIWEVRNY